MTPPFGPGDLAEAQLAAAIAERRAAEEGGWRDHLLRVIVAAPLLGPAIEAVHLIRRLL